MKLSTGILGCCAALVLLPAGSCVNKEFTRQVSINYDDIAKEHLLFLEERGRLTKAFFVEKLGQAAGEKFWQEIKVREYSADQVKISARQVQTLKELIDAAKE